ncbi:zinc ribbon domain-containing protein [Candidatus Azambacteria bacterium]|nr:zinc ribbon domain-containing protein [Candidatus Azambacteria bacterium]MBI3685553.1 zinc ribbon domain-containing protein [Candidatus Azambacteria bacterium]
MNSCKKCGKLTEADNQFCQSCGTQVTVKTHKKTWLKYSVIILGLIIILLFFGWKSFSSYVSYNVAVHKAQDTKRIGDFQNLQLSLTLYYTEHGAYPQNLSELVPRYLSEVPLDPREGENHENSACESTIGKGTFSYRYKFTESGKKFTLSTCLEEGEVLAISPHE